MIEYLMALTEQTVTHIAKLARIRLNDDEKQHFTQELSGIMAWIEQLAEVDTGDTQAVASVTQHSLPLRSDTITETPMSDAVLRNAPVSEYDCYAVPKVIDQG